MSIVMSGIVLANVINLPLAGALCATGIDRGWPMIMYIPGKLNFTDAPARIKYSRYTHHTIRP